MASHAQVSGPMYQTITGGQIALSDLSEAEYGFLDVVAKKYSPKQDWTRFAAWWNTKFNASGLPMASAMYRICQDLEARLGINQGKVSSPDYRDCLAELIDAQFSSRQDFCRACGVDPGQLSRVLASRDNLSIKVLVQVLEVLHARLVIQKEQDSRAQTSIDRAIEAIGAVLSTRSKPPGIAGAKSVGPLSANDSDIGTTVLPDWKASFPYVHDIDNVVAGARCVAQHLMPLMIADAA
jgi:transcriptional regulator with XRE-family HTH domain